MAQEDWRATIQSLALEVQEEAENLRWLGRRDGPEATTSEREEAQEEPQRKKRKGKGKGQSPRKVGKNYKVVKKYALNFEKRLMQVSEVSRCSGGGSILTRRVALLAARPPSSSSSCDR